MERRQFMQAAAIGAGLLLCPRFIIPGPVDAAETTSKKAAGLHPASYYVKLPEGIVECHLCPRHCQVSNLERGYCGVRENIDREYYTLVYGRACSANIDPIEKKPLFHFLPGTAAFSIATAGCNMNCKFCQNWSISQFRPEDVTSVELSPEECAATAGKNNCPTIAYTYSEPTIFYEYMLDCVKSGKKKGLRSVVISAGFIEKKPLLELASAVDAIKIDLKSFSESYYVDICHGHLKPVLDTLINVKSSGTWLEIVYLMLPGLNDSPKEISALSDWIMANLGPDVPLHFTRFYPAYLLQNLPATPIESLEKAHTIARDKGLHYVYIGNVYGNRAENTFCPNCGKLLIGRRGFEITANNISEGKCPYCGTKIPGIWS